MPNQRSKKKISSKKTKRISHNKQSFITTCLQGQFHYQTLMSIARRIPGFPFDQLSTVPGTKQQVLCRLVQNCFSGKTELKPSQKIKNKKKSKPTHRKKVKNQAGLTRIAGDTLKRMNRRIAILKLHIQKLNDKVKPKPKPKPKQKELPPVASKEVDLLRSQLNETIITRDYIEGLYKQTVRQQQEMMIRYNEYVQMCELQQRQIHTNAKVKEGLEKRVQALTDQIQALLQRKGGGHLVKLMKQREQLELRVSEQDHLLSTQRLQIQEMMNELGRVKSTIIVLNQDKVALELKVATLHNQLVHEHTERQALRTYLKLSNDASMKDTIEAIQKRHKLLNERWKEAHDENIKLKHTMRTSKAEWDEERTEILQDLKQAIHERDTAILRLRQANNNGVDGGAAIDIANPRHHDVYLKVVQERDDALQQIQHQDVLIQQLRHQLTDMPPVINVGDARLVEQLKAQLATTQVQLVDNHNQLVETRSTADALRTERDGLNSKLLVLDQQNENLQYQLDSEKKQKEKMMDDLQEEKEKAQILTTEIETLNRELATLDEKNENMTRKLLDQKTKNKALKTQLSESTAKADELLIERDSLSRELISVQNQQQVLQRQFDQLETERDGLNTQVTSLEKKNDKLKTKVATTLEEKRVLSEKFTQLQVQLTTEQTEHQSREEELKRQNEELRDQIQNLKNAIPRGDNDHVKVLQQQLVDMKQELTTTRAALDTTKEALNVSKEDRQSLRDRLAERTSEYERINGLYISLQDQQRNTTSEFKQQMSELKQAHTDKLEQMQDEMKTLKDEYGRNSVELKLEKQKLQDENNTLKGTTKKYETYLRQNVPQWREWHREEQKGEELENVAATELEQTVIRMTVDQEQLKQTILNLEATITQYKAAVPPVDIHAPLLPNPGFTSVVTVIEDDDEDKKDDDVPAARVPSMSNVSASQDLNNLLNMVRNGVASTGDLKLNDAIIYEWTQARSLVQEALDVDGGAQWDGQMLTEEDITVARQIIAIIDARLSADRDRNKPNKRARPEEKDSKTEEEDRLVAEQLERDKKSRPRVNPKELERKRREIEQLSIAKSMRELVAAREAQDRAAAAAEEARLLAERLAPGEHKSASRKRGVGSGGVVDHIQKKRGLEDGQVDYVFHHLAGLPVPRRRSPRLIAAREQSEEAERLAVAAHEQAVEAERLAAAAVRSEDIQFSANPDRPRATRASVRQIEKRRLEAEAESIRISRMEQLAAREAQDREAERKEVERIEAERREEARVHAKTVNRSSQAKLRARKTISKVSKNKMKVQVKRDTHITSKKYSARVRGIRSSARIAAQRRNESEDEKSEDESEDEMKDSEYSSNGIEDSGISMLSDDDDSVDLTDMVDDGEQSIENSRISMLADDDDVDLNEMVQDGEIVNNDMIRDEEDQPGRDRSPSRSRSEQPGNSQRRRRAQAQPLGRRSSARLRAQAASNSQPPEGGYSARRRA